MCYIMLRIFYDRWASKMKKWMFTIGMVMVAWGIGFSPVHAEEIQEVEQEKHNWVEYSEDFHDQKWYNM